MKNFKKIVAAMTATALTAACAAVMPTAVSAAEGDPEIGQAYIIGQFYGENQLTNWTLGEEASIKATSINGDGTYEVEWQVPEAIGSIGFMAVKIEPTGDVDNFTTDTLPNLTATIDEVWVDGTKMDSYTASKDAVNTHFYESGPGVTRLYLTNEWVSPKVMDVPKETVIEQSIKVVFTLSGTAIPYRTYGDVNNDGEIKLDDAYEALMEDSRRAVGIESTLTDEDRTYADVDGDGTVTLSDAYSILMYTSLIAIGEEITPETYFPAAKVDKEA